jgi:hypothetical protein
VPVIYPSGLLVCEPFDSCNDIGLPCVPRVPEGQPCNFVPNGDPCVIGTYCDVGDAGTVGVCHPNRAAGQPCALEILAGGLASMGGCMSGICGGGICDPLPPPPPGIGALCGADAGVCGFELWCENGTCQTADCELVLPEGGSD